VVVTSGGVSSHISASAFDLGNLGVGLPQAVRTTTATAATVRAIAGMPTRLLPKGGFAFPVPNDNVALTRLRPPRGQQGLGGPRPLLCSAGKQQLNKKGTNRRLLDVI
jgi:PPE-repeat protein